MIYRLILTLLLAAPSSAHAAPDAGAWANMIHKCHEKNGPAFIYGGEELPLAQLTGTALDTLTAQRESEACRSDGRCATARMVQACSIWAAVIETPLAAGGPRYELFDSAKMRFLTACTRDAAGDCPLE